MKRACQGEAASARRTAGRVRAVLTHRLPLLCSLQLLHQGAQVVLPRADLAPLRVADPVQEGAVEALGDVAALDRAPEDQPQRHLGGPPRRMPR